MKYFIKKQKYSTIIFDMDGVLTPRPITFDAWYKHILLLIQIKLNITTDEATSFLYKHNIFGDNSQQQGPVTKLMMKLGYTREEWNNYKNKNFSIKDFVDEDNELADLLKKLGEEYILIILSNNILDTVNKNLAALNIDAALFKLIVAYDKPAGLKQEPDKLKYILSIVIQDFDSVIVIGDKFETDLKPVLDCGGSGILIEEQRETKYLIKSLLKINNY